MPEYPVSASNYRDPYDHDHDHAACLHQPLKPGQCIVKVTSEDMDKMFPPDQPGAVVTPAGSLVDNIAALHKLAENILDPEMYGFAVSAEVRDAARRALGFPAVEWKERQPREEKLYTQSQMDAAIARVSGK